MRTAWPYIALVGVIAGLGLWLWRSTAGPVSPERAGFHVLCSDPACGHDFIIPRDEVRTFPRGPQGEGFKCEKCGKFGARIARQCSGCQRWYLPDASSAQGRMSGLCPPCAAQPSR